MFVLSPNDKKKKPQPKKGKAGCNKPKNAEVSAKMIRQVGAAVKSASQKYLTSTVGSALSAVASNVVAKISGHGSYSIRKNTLPMGEELATFKSVVHGDGVRIIHREFVQNIEGSAYYTNRFRTHINPGLASAFPWLSTIAMQFEEWQPNGILFQYVPTSGNIAVSTPALGVVVAATQYDLSDGPFTSKVQIESTQYCSSTVPCGSMVHPVECERDLVATKILRVRHTDEVIDPAENQFYDLGITTVATTGMNSQYVTGELWVTYDITLMKPRINLQGLVGEMYHFVSTPAGAAAFVCPQGTNGFINLVPSYSPSPLRWVNRTLELKPGRWLVSGIFIAGTTLDDVPGLTLTNGTYVTAWNSGATAFFGMYEGAAANFDVVIDAEEGCTVVLNAPGNYGLGNTDVVVVRIPSGFGDPRMMAKALRIGSTHKPTLRELAPEHFNPPPVPVEQPVTRTPSPNTPPPVNRKTVL